MSHSTPIIPCPSSSAIQITHSSAPTHPMSSPGFSVPSPLVEPLRVASEHLRAGRTVALPTETVYGLAANALDPAAVSKIYQIKNRPSDNPLIIHVSSLKMLQRLLPPLDQYKPSRLYMGLMQAFWPGPLTLLFPSPSPPPPPAPQTNAIRMPSHPLALAIINTADIPLSAPSANSSGRPSPTEAQHVYNDLNGAEGLGCILDGGPCGVGVESTVLNGLSWKDGGGGVVDVLRPGGLRVEEIARVVAQVDGGEGITDIFVHGKPWRSHASASSNVPMSTNGAGTGPLRVVEELPAAPGMKYRHYSPGIPVFLLLPSNTFPSPDSSKPEEHATASEVVSQLADCLRKDEHPRIGLLHYENSPLYLALASSMKLRCELVPVSLGSTTEEAAQRLFAAMLRLEGLATVTSQAASSQEKSDSAVDAILVEGCSDEGMGLAVMERVSKAVGGGGSSGDLSVARNDTGRYWVKV